MKGLWERIKNMPRLQLLHTVMITALLLILLAMASYLAYSAVQFTCTVDYSEQVLIGYDVSVWKHAGIFLAVSLGALGLELLMRKFQVQEEKIGLAVLAGTSLIICIMGFSLISGHPYYPLGDQLITSASASYVLQGDYHQYVHWGYMGMYPQQKSLVFLYEILFAVFGHFCYDVAEVFHIGFCVVIAVCGYFVLKNWGQKVVNRVLFCFLMVCCLPVFLYIPYIYGDLPSIAFCMAMFWAVSEYMKQYRLRYLVVAVMAAVLAVMVRRNVLIVLVALVIGMVLAALKKRSWMPLLAAVCIIGVSLTSIAAINFMYEKRSGYEYEGGIPSILWVAMGLQETRGMPGRYNRYQQAVYSETGFDREVASAIGREYIGERLAEFQADPAMAMDFFHRKLLQQWTEPTFEAFCHTANFAEGEEVPEYIMDLYYRDWNRFTIHFSNFYQSVVYVAFLLFVVRAFVDRDRESTLWIPLIAIVGGFLFSIIWESKSRYILPYFVLMILYAPQGLCWITFWWDRIRKWLRQGGNGKMAE